MEILNFIWTNIFYNPVLNTLIVLYEVGFQNLGLAVLLMTGVIKLITAPLTKSQIESTQKLQEIRPELEALQKKYSKDPITFQKKQQELYKRVNYQPLGCFTTLIVQLPIIIALYTAVRNFSDGKIDGVYPFVADMFDLGSKIVVNTQFFFWDLAQSFNSVAKEFGQLSKEALPYLLLAVLVGLAQYVSTRFMTGARPKPEKKEKPKGSKDDGKIDPTEMMEQMNKSIRITMPLIIGFTALSLPAVLGYYWIISSLMQVLQQILIGDRQFIFNKAKLRFNQLLRRDVE